MGVTVFAIPVIHRRPQAIAWAAEGTSAIAGQIIFITGVKYMPGFMSEDKTEIFFSPAIIPEKQMGVWASHVGIGKITVGESIRSRIGIVSNKDGIGPVGSNQSF
jgi:hypothetical protein